jgi:hypothetical protein
VEQIDIFRLGTYAFKSISRDPNSSQAHIVARNSLPQAQVEQALKRLGRNLRTARIRRRLTIDEAAQKIGTGPRAVMDA